MFLVPKCAHCRRINKAIYSSNHHHYFTTIILFAKQISHTVLFDYFVVATELRIRGRVGVVGAVEWEYITSG
jgi:hypothetical protein